MRKSIFCNLQFGSFMQNMPGAIEKLKISKNELEEYKWLMDEQGGFVDVLY